MTEEDPTLTVLDEMVMRELTRTITTVSVVRLAADLWDQSGQFHGPGPVDLVANIIEDLGQRGLLTYRENDVFAGMGHVYNPETGKTRATSIYQNLPHTIRLTQKGWALMGYPTRHLEAGSIRAQKHHEGHTGDRTNYRRHSDTAEGGPVSRETFEQHRRSYPLHIHMYGGELEFDMAIQRRRYTRVTPEMEAAVIVYKNQHPEATHAMVAEETEVPERTVGYILTELPRLRSLRDEDNGTSLKDRIVLYLEQMEYKNVADLRRVLGRADDTHNIVHVLHSLRTEGKVTFDEQRDSKAPIKIRLTRAGEAHAEKIDYDQRQKLEDEREEKAEQERLQIENSAKPPPLDHPQKVANHEQVLTPEQRLTKNQTYSGYSPLGQPDNPYPLLHDLTTREQQRYEVDAKQTAYLNAAEALRGVDDDAARDLIAKAAESDIPFPSPLEAEYMRYVIDHARNKE